MPALPFVLKRSDDVVSGTAVTSTTERIHGLLSITGDHLVVQWRLARETDHVAAASIRTERELEPVREVAVPLGGLAGAAVRRGRWWHPWRGLRIVLTASDLRAFEQVAGTTGLKLDHPAVLTLPLQRNQGLAALEFAAELNLLLAQRDDRQATSHQLPSRETRELPGADLVEPRRSGIEGLGLFARTAIAAGQRIRRIDVVRQVTAESPLREELGERADHCDYPDGKVVLIGFPDHCLNHSCDPNAYLYYEADSCWIVARRDIAAGEEVTCDYSINLTGGSSWPCHCGAARCRGTVTGDFFSLPAELQREYRPLLADWFVRRHEHQLVHDDDRDLKLDAD